MTIAGVRVVVAQPRHGARRDNRCYPANPRRGAATVTPGAGVSAIVSDARDSVPNEVIPGQVEGARLRVIDAVRSINRYEVEIQQKFALAAACFIFVLLGAPIALRFPRALEELRNGALHLTAILLLSLHLTDETADALLA